MSTVALMWEARAAEGRGPELLAWARAQGAEGEPLRREVFRAPQDRVLVVTWWETEDGLAADLPELPAPPAELIGRPVHRWRFESVEAVPGR
ncbi:hypothetical protein SUDANB120_03771 [Streptomyces sp. enrichment culture]|uniref:hypothetical protein n=1 Tax=Streptomyces TaxID=1883 RepID=UPI001E43F360|nr:MULTISPECIES: hypothetical protein [Streptomyces]